MINRTTSIRQQAAAVAQANEQQNQRRTPIHNTHNNSYNQPMSNNLQLQLQQQKQLLNENKSNASYVEPEEEIKEPSVLNNWWAWIAFLCTCCFPNYIIRVWFGKSNKGMQQAWREKVCNNEKEYAFKYSKFIQF
jgi:hypothetical protein